MPFFFFFLSLSFGFLCVLSLDCLVIDLFASSSRSLKTSELLVDGKTSLRSQRITLGHGSWGLESGSDEF